MLSQRPPTTGEAPPVVIPRASGHVLRPVGLRCLLLALALAVTPGGSATAQGPPPGGRDPGLPPEFQGTVQYDEETRRQIELARQQMQQWEQAKQLGSGRGPGIDQLLNCEHAVRAASGHPWLVDQAKAKCDQERQRQGEQTVAPQIQGPIDGCWAPFDRALAALEAAKDLYTQARRATTPQQGQLVQQGQTRQREAKDALGQGRQCLERLVRLAVEIGEQLMREMLARLDGSQPAGTRGGRVAQEGTDPRSGQTGTGGPRGTPTGTSDRGGQGTPALEAQIREQVLRELGKPSERLRGMAQALLDCPREIGEALLGGGEAFVMEFFTIGTYLGAENYRGLGEHLYGAGTEQARRLAEGLAESVKAQVGPYASAYDEGYRPIRGLCNLLVADRLLRMTKVATKASPSRPSAGSAGSPPRTPASGGSSSGTAPVQRGGGTSRTAPVVEGQTRAGALTGQVMNVPALGQFRLGALVTDDGVFGSIYEIEGNPSYLVKVIKEAGGEGTESLGRQLAGHHHIQQSPGIPTPRIIDKTPRGPGGRPALVVENLKGPLWSGKGVQMGVTRDQLTLAHLDAIEALYQDLGRRGLVWVDGHLNNMFFLEEGGRLRAGIVDHDLLFPIDKYTRLSRSLRMRVQLAYRDTPAAQALIDATRGEPVVLPTADELMALQFQMRKFPALRDGLRAAPR